MARIAWSQAPETGNPELTACLNAILDAIKGLDRQGLADVADVTGTAGATYTVNEQLLINDLVVAVNAVLANT